MCDSLQQGSLLLTASLRTRRLFGTARNVSTRKIAGSSVRVEKRNDDAMIGLNANATHGASGCFRHDGLEKRGVLSCRDEIPHEGK